MTISPKMLAVIQKLEAVHAAHLAALRATAKRDAQAKTRAKGRAAIKARVAAKKKSSTAR
jgi:hypothetical protein